jgi:hypothetical protein
MPSLVIVLHPLPFVDLKGSCQLWQTAEDTDMFRFILERREIMGHL